MMLIPGRMSQTRTQRVRRESPSEFKCQILSTSVSKSQLRYWDQTGFFTPAFANENRRVAFSRIYSFKDITSLRVINVLRNQYSVPLQHLRKVAVELSDLSDAK